MRRDTKSTLPSAPSHFETRCPDLPMGHSEEPFFVIIGLPHRALSNPLTPESPIGGSKLQPLAPSEVTTLCHRPVGPVSSKGCGSPILGPAPQAVPQPPRLGGASSEPWQKEPRKAAP